MAHAQSSVQYGHCEIWTGKYTYWACNNRTDISMNQAQSRRMNENKHTQNRTKGTWVWWSEKKKRRERLKLMKCRNFCFNDNSKEICVFRQCHSVINWKPTIIFKAMAREAVKLCERHNRIMIILGLFVWVLANMIR